MRPEILTAILDSVEGTFNKTISAKTRGRLHEICANMPDACAMEIRDVLENAERIPDNISLSVWRGYKQWKNRQPGGADTMAQYGCEYCDQGMIDAKRISDGKPAFFLCANCVTEESAVPKVNSFDLPRLGFIHLYYSPSKEAKEAVMRMKAGESAHAVWTEISHVVQAR